MGNISGIFEYYLGFYLEVSGFEAGIFASFGNKNCQIKRFVY